MRLSIAKWGNSLALRLPSRIAKESRLGEGSAVTVEVQRDGSLIVTPIRRKLKLSELLEGASGRDEAAEAVDWGKPAGKEVW
ncbi:MAG: AbrB/MazE/SpoVT family DNA-binding domain-containing protein [Paracoccaceae bacterium]